MFYIDQTTPEFIAAREEHYRNVRYVIKKKLLGKRFTEAHPKGLSQRISQVYGIQSQVARYLDNEDNLKKILIGTPDELDRLKNMFKSKKAVGSIKSLVRYDSFSDKGESGTFRFYNGFHLAKNLKQHTCIYCNRAYTSTIITDKNEFVARPTFDHWFPQSKFPILALSFYNLIPSCSVCNSTLKGATQFAIDDVFHPYFRHADSNKQLNFRFSYDLEDYVRAKSTIITKNSFSQQSVEAMKLAEIYSVHAEDIREMIYLKLAYTQSYIQSLNSILRGFVLTSEEVYRLAFGVYFEDDKLHTRPLSKLKKDILIELGIVK
ncbi:MAG TPA: hypothetical protein VG890_05325 [Puia sp.]|nr:hypothetical protein [Puia sp.]